MPSGLWPGVGRLFLEFFMSVPFEGSGSGMKAFAGPVRNIQMTVM